MWNGDRFAWTAGAVAAGAAGTILLAVALGGCPMTMPTGGTTGPGTNGQGTVQVTIQNMTFLPKQVTISTGQTVEWVNNDPFAHTVTSGNPADNDVGQVFDSGNINAGQTFSFKFNNAGTFKYFCRIHGAQAMSGTVVVQQ